MLAVQLVKRATTDRYGNPRGRRWTDRYRPLATRNGIPARLYDYRGTETLEAELPYLCDGDCGRRRAKPGLCAVCSGYYDKTRSEEKRPR